MSGLERGTAVPFPLECAQYVGKDAWEILICDAAVAPGAHRGSD
eukprot:CAMPEP_0184489408 /NCGR_PEP_ID=MMETSP0113_2-20130426/15310_1 /TAXON_ID=91329 /ORGANISM="Norrisiella sphaerica, Strain BC52" /LENGTH=43 /DNA_ID= /DNA_START= /DNA_END= /DNA_ORIENTATION=